MANIRIDVAKKQINQDILYIDSAKFIVDAAVFDEINIPTEFILVDKDTGEEIDNFKRNSLRITYNDFHFYIANYKKYLRGVEYNKFVILMSAKVSSSYLGGIQINDLKAILSHVKKLGYISYQDSQIDDIINSFRVNDTDITCNKVIEKKELTFVIEQFHTIKANSTKKESVNVFNKQKNKGIQFGKRGDRYFFKIYNKSLEIQEEINKLKITPEQRAVFQDYDVMRFEMTIRNKKDYDKFGIDNRFVSVLKLLKDEPKKIHLLIREYYDNMIGIYKPRTKRSAGELSPSELPYLSLCSELKDKGYDVYKMSVIFLSGFDSNIDKLAKHRLKKKFYKVMDVLYSNKEDISEKNMLAMKGYDFIREAFFLD